MTKIRKAAVAGGFYPGDKSMLMRSISEYLVESVKVDLPDTFKAVVVPHAGYMYSGVVAGAGYRFLKALDKAVRWKVLLIGPSHFVPFYDAAVPEVEAWETPLGVLPVKSVLDEIGESDVIIPLEKVFTEEHSLEVQVPFLQTVLGDFDLYPLCLGEVDPLKLADDLRDFAARDDVIIVVSSDLSHYLPYEEALRVDDAANKLIPLGDIDNVRETVDACGIKGILVLMELAKALGWHGHFVDYKNSGDTAGDKSQVVGYGCYAFTK